MLLDATIVLLTLCKPLQFWSKAPWFIHRSLVKECSTDCACEPQNWFCVEVSIWKLLGMLIFSIVCCFILLGLSFYGLAFADLNIAINLRRPSQRRHLSGISTTPERHGFWLVGRSVLIVWRECNAWKMRKPCGTDASGKELGNPWSQQEQGRPDPKNNSTDLGSQ